MDGWPPVSGTRQQEYWLVRVLKCIGNALVAAFIHATKWGDTSRPISWGLSC